MKSSRVPKLLAYVITPVVFCLVGYLLLWVGLQPVWGMGEAAVGFLVSKDAPNFNPELKSIYDPDVLKRGMQPAENDGQAAPDDRPNNDRPHNDRPHNDRPHSANPISGEDVQFPFSETQYGQIVCGEIGLDSPVYWYDSEDILAYGVGTSMIGKLPGFGGLILLAGHALTNFACLEAAAPGQVIQFNTNYENYDYTITDVQVMNENDLEKLVLQKADEPREELVMYCCYPFHAIEGRKTDRLVVFADRTAGADVIWREEG